MCFVANESRKDEIKSKVVHSCKAVGSTMEIVNTTGLSLNFARFLPEDMLVQTLVCVVVILVWKEKEKLRIRSVQMNNLKEMIEVIRNERIRDICSVGKGVNELVRMFLKCMGML